MAYTVTMSKESVFKGTDGIYRVTLGITVTDGAVEVFSSSLTARYNPASTDLTALKLAIQEELKAQWDKFVAEQGILNAAELDTMLSEIQTAATTYVNS